MQMDLPSRTLKGKVTEVMYHEKRVDELQCALAEFKQKKQNHELLLQRIVAELEHEQLQRIVAELERIVAELEELEHEQQLKELQRALLELEE